MKMEVKKTKEEQEERRKIEEFRSITDKLYDPVNIENKFANKSYDEIKKEIEDISGKDSNPLSELQTQALYYTHFPPNCDIEVFEKPDWLDVDKFQKGQRFARDHLFGLFIGQFYGLLCLLCHQDGLDTLIMTQKSHTPYLAFKRYLSTNQRVRNWYKEDPWCKDTQAYQDILKVRKMHLTVRTKLVKLDHEEIKAISAINNPYCPVFQSVIDDLSTTSKYSFADYWYDKQQLSNVSGCSSKLNIRSINQMDMSLTLFGFMGFPILFPDYFGMNEDKDEDLENLCYVWRCIGYLLGVDDEVNMCRGSLKDIRGRCREYVEEFVKPAFRRISPQWEHMIKCIIEGQSYIHKVPNFETVVLQIADLLELQLPSLYSSLTYFQRIKYYFSKFFLGCVMKSKFIQNFANKIINRAMDMALHFDNAKLTELKKRSMSSSLHVTVGN